MKMLSRMSIGQFSFNTFYQKKRKKNAFYLFLPKQETKEKKKTFKNVNIAFCTVPS
jgi:hypothetical protein